MIPAEIQRAVDELLKRVQFSWDADDSMDRAYVESSPFGVLVRSFRKSSARGSLDRRLGLLAVFGARRSLPAWEVWCNDDAPRQLVLLLEKWARNGVFLEEREKYVQLPEPYFRGQPIKDCRRGATRSAAEAARNAALLISRRDPFPAIYSFSAADRAINQSFSPEQDNFRKWFIEIAIPAAVGGRELTEEEQNAYRNFTDADISKWRTRAETSADW